MTVIVTEGLTFTITSTIKGAPGQPLAVGITVYCTEPAVVAVLVKVCETGLLQDEEQLLKPVIDPLVAAVQV